MVRYERVTLLFYALVQNNSYKICDLPEKTYNLLNSYGIDVVRAESKGVFKDYDQLCDGLCEVYK